MGRRGADGWWVAHGERGGGKAGEEGREGWMRGGRTEKWLVLFEGNGGEVDATVLAVLINWIKMRLIF